MAGLHGHCLDRFNDDKEWYFGLLPKKYQNIIILRWLNVNFTPVDIQNWDGLYDYAVNHPYRNEVFQDNVTAVNRTASYDEIVRRAITKAATIYNKCKAQYYD